ncbi:MAG TPA: hypothetical protein VGM83_14910 [Devosiaceae bacterium]|jgi:hypothetical protein
MADYKELLRRAIGALPENNGAARRAVYEKARAALVGQLRAIDPPLPAREITQHRLQLEDCIRQVEQEASEAVIAGLKQRDHVPPPPVVPVVALEPEAAAEPEPEIVVAAAESAADEQDEMPEEPVLVAELEAQPEPELAPEPEPESEPVIAAMVEPEAEIEPQPEPEPVEAFEPGPEAPVQAEAPRQPAAAGSIEDIIAAAERASTPTGPTPLIIVAPKLEPKPEIVGKDVERAAPSIVARAEANKSGPSSPLTFRSPTAKPFNPILRPPTFEPRRGDAANVVAATRIEPAPLHGQALARQQVTSPLATVEQQVALSSVREVELEPALGEASVNDPQKAIDRAIETLDREARGETVPPANGNTVEVNTFEHHDEKPAQGDARRGTLDVEDDFDAKPPARGGGNAVTIFLLVFVLLLAGVGGAGYWAWREGYVDPAALFGESKPVAEAALPTPASPTQMPTETMSDAAPPVQTENTSAGNVASTPEVPAPANLADSTPGPGNTVASNDTAEPTQELKGDDRLLPQNQVIAAETAEPTTSPSEPDKADDRLPTSDASTGQQVATAEAGAPDAAAMAGSQSLLLEASDDGTTGAVPFSGTVDWSEGKDELGQPTLVGKASIPARNLGVDVLIRKNADPSLPASHLMEINFSVSETFMGGSIAGLPGVLLKNEELVQGTPLAGASARVVGNSFLFALNASPDDMTTNNNLLTTRKWMDLAIIYATGKRAILTLEKDDKAEALFTKVFAEWAKAGDAKAASSN